MPYTHSGANASSIAMNKLLTKNYLSQFSENTAEKIIFPKTYDFKSLNEYKKYLPLVLKPISGGSSVEINILNNENDLNHFKDKLFSKEKSSQFLINIIKNQSPEFTGKFIAWDSSEIPW